MNMRVLIAPDSFKGTITAAEAAAALAAGWRDVRPGDLIHQLPLADGGEGTIAALAAAQPDAVLHHVFIAGPHGARISVPWLGLPDGTAAVELAACCGLPLLPTPDPLRTSTAPLGQLIGQVMDSGVPRLLIGLGGSASTDGGTGALRELGARFLDADGAELPPGGGPLHRLATVDTANLRLMPPSGVELLTDITNPLIGPLGAAVVFAPQKGAGPHDVALIDAGLRRLRKVVGVRADPGSGAAGGTAYGLASLWGAQIVHGARRVLMMVGFGSALSRCDLVLTGEGSFDSQSLGGKAVGTVLESAAHVGVPSVVVAGRVVRGEVGNVDAISLTDLAESSARAVEAPARWLARAAAKIAGQFR